METLKWNNNKLTIIDQTKLPTKLEYIECDNYKRVVLAIKRLEVRGAPAIGSAAAFAMLLAANEFCDLPLKDFLQKLSDAKQEIANARPTAVNLSWAIEKLWRDCVQGKLTVQDIVSNLEKSAIAIFSDDIEINKKIGLYGASILPENINVLTHCNAGALATCGWGTALGVVRQGFNDGKINMVYADETRPLLQGSRITAWELSNDNIPVTVITDSMAGWVMKNSFVQAVIVGADRIAANGDTANKIGTYSLAVLANYHKIPFYIAAPKSTFDFTIKDGSQIPIEQRHADEVTTLAGIKTAPEKIKVFNPAFDITPNELICGIITEYGVLYPSYIEAINKLKNS